MAISPSRRLAVAVLTTALLCTGITASVAATIPTPDAPELPAGAQCTVPVVDEQITWQWRPYLPTPR